MTQVLSKLELMELIEAITKMQCERLCVSREELGLAEIDYFIRTGVIVIRWANGSSAEAVICPDDTIPAPINTTVH